MALIETVRSFLGLSERTMVYPPLLPGQDNWFPWVNFEGNLYGALQQTMPASPQEEPDGTFASFVQGAYKSDGIVFACLVARMLLFSEARFQWRRVRGGTVGELFGTEALTILEHPSPGHTTGDLLSRAIQDADLGGNSFHVRIADRIHRARPDWMTIVLGSRSSPEVDFRDVEAEVMGYVYHPGGRGSGHEPEVYLPEEVAHFAPIPDPVASFRGMSPLAPVIREVMGDKAATDHKLRFFENAATPNLAIKAESVKDIVAFDAWVDKLEAKHKGAANAYRTLYLAAGMDATVLGTNLRQMDFKATQGAGETRIAAALGVPPVIAGFSEGLQGSSLNTGNYSAARRRFSDLTIRPLWRNICGSLEAIVPPPSNAQLWYDDRDIAFLREDAKDRAAIQAEQASTMGQLFQAGWLPESIVAAIIAEDYTLLEHSGLPSVQVQPAVAPTPEPPTNGKTTMPEKPGAMVSSQG